MRLNQAQKEHIALTKHFEDMWNNPPAPFNPVDPNIKRQYDRAVFMADAQAKREGLSTVPTERLERILELRSFYEAQTITDEDLKAALDYYWED